MFFQINITPEAHKPQQVLQEVIEPKAVVILAPFQPQTHLKIESSVNVPAYSSVIIKNTSERSLNAKITKIPPEERKIVLSSLVFEIEPKSERELYITWTPNEAGCWRDILQLTDSRRVKYDIAISTIATSPKKVLSKSKRILAQSNEIKHETNYQKKTITQQYQLSKPKENKENDSHNVHERRSERRHFDTSTRALSSEMSGIFDISSFQLTPLRNNTTQITEKSNITIKSDIKFSPQKENNIISPEFRRQTFVHPNLESQNHYLSSVKVEMKDTNDEHSLRRETYDNPNPRFCITNTNSGKQEDVRKDEKFDDSLSPQPNSNKQSNFSMLINNMANFITPIKMEKLSPNGCSTAQKSYSNNFANNTFEIESSEIQVKNETYSFEKSPIRSTSTVIRPNRLTDSFEKMSPIKSQTCTTQNQLLTSPISRFQDNASARQVLEADLWVKKEETSKVFRGNSKGLEMIMEDRITVASRTFTQPSNLSTNQTAFCFEISPVKKLGIRKSANIKRISPKKTGKSIKDKSILQHSTIKKKINGNITMKNRGIVSIPGVKITKLSLAGINKTTKCQSKAKEISVKLYDPNDFISFNPDPFAATMTEDPFLANTLYYDEKWMWHQEMEFKKWLNALLTPPEHLSADVDSMKVDIGKVWQSSRTKENVILAETRETVSARYHTNTRLNTLRKAAFAMFTRNELRTIFSQTAASIERGTLVVRQDRDLHRDIGLQKEILELFLSYNPLWLRIGLEVVYGETIPLHSNNDLVGLTKFLITRFFSDPFLSQKHSHPTTSLKMPTFMPHLNKFILKKFLFIVYFLDYAKKNKLIGHDPCLFHKKATCKESREILINFSRQVLSGVGDITKVLRQYGYVVSQKQTYLDEYDYAVNDISIDLRDGVRLCRVMELITGTIDLTRRCRAPAISRLQKVHNAELALTALHQAGYTITGDIDAKTVADGHREKTLSLLWQIIYKFQAPRFAACATTIQTWWRSKLWYIRTRNFLRNRKSNAAIVIQCAWRCYKARQSTNILREKRAADIKLRIEAAKVLQLHWRCKLKMLKDRKEFLKQRSAAMILQKWYRRLRATRPFTQELKRKREAVVIFQKHWRATQIMKIERTKYKYLLKTTITIQNWWRSVFKAKQDLQYYQKIKKSTLIIQSRWRAKKSMEIAKKSFSVKITAIKTIQLWWRSIIAMKRNRNDYLIKKNAVNIISSWWINLKLSRNCRNRYLAMLKAALAIQFHWQARNIGKLKRKAFLLTKLSVIKIQSYWRMIQAQRNYKKLLERNEAAKILQQRWRAKKTGEKIQQLFIKQKMAVLIIQRRYRAMLTMRETRKNYLNILEAAVKIQKRWRARKIGKETRENYLQIRSASIYLQSTWKMILARRNFIKQKSAAIIIQRKYRATIKAREGRKKYLQLVQAAVKLQQRWRARKIGKETRENYLQIRKAAICLQSNWKMIFTKNKYQKQRKAAICIQNTWRAILIARKTKADYLALKKLTIYLQRRYRARKIGQQVRNNYLLYKSKIIIIQRQWRKVLVLQERNEAATIIQCWWRSILITRACRINFQLRRDAAIFIQQKYRAYKIGSKIRKDYQNLRTSVIKIQKIWKQLIIKKRQKDLAEIHKKSVLIIENWWIKTLIEKRIKDVEYIKKKKINNSAIIIQSFWRGYKVRKMESSVIQKVRQRSKTATEAAHPTATVGFKLQEAIIVLQNFTSVGQLSMCLACIDTLTRLSIKGCIEFCENNFVEKIYDILAQSNRSLPWMDVCLRCTNILITVTKLPDTAQYTRNIYYMETIARLMTVAVKRETDLFLHLATLLWLLAGDPIFSVEITNCQRTIWLIKSLSMTIMKTDKKNIGSTPTRGKNTMSIEKSALLPNTKPDWGLETRRPRTFTTIHHAMSALMIKLKIH